MAAPDPKDPDMVYGSMRTGVSLYDRKLQQSTTVGPVTTGFARYVRTMPLMFSPVDNTTMFYGQDAVFKSTNHGYSWTRISGDLARQHWAVPASVGKYASQVHDTAQGSLTALAPSPRDIKVLWAGTDDGVIQVTTDGGAKWIDVTPPTVKPWARVFNMDAGHFDSKTAYAAVNTLRIDDINPHFYRTHNGGQTWTEINSGISSGAVSNSIREDPRKNGLLYAATDLQVWVSYDDGDHWESIKYDMPPVSVRDIAVKDDPTCMCADLVAGTHGRGFWILDDLTPFRQAAEIRAAKSAGKAYLVKPVTAVRVRFSTNDPTPWPPETPAGENVLPGALLDYYLPSNASQPVRLEILDAAGKVVRHYTSAMNPTGPTPTSDPIAYDKMCQQMTTLPDCGLPLYWPAPPLMLGTSAGAHRFSWDLHYDPVDGSEAGFGIGGGAVPHRVYPSVNTPWAPPGAYTVKLTVDGASYTQPLTLKMDPRVKTPATALASVATMTRDLYASATSLHDTHLKARALSDRLGGLQGADVVAFKAQLDSIAPLQVGGGGRGGRGGGGGGGGGGRGGRGGAETAAPTLPSATAALIGAANAFGSADVAPTASRLDAVAKAKADAAVVMKKWTTLSTSGLASLNAKRKAAGQPTVPPGV